MSDIVSAYFTNKDKTQVRVTYVNKKEIAIPASATDTRYVELVKWAKGGNKIKNTNPNYEVK